MVFVETVVDELTGVVEGVEVSVVIGVVLVDELVRIFVVSVVGELV